MNYYKCGGEVIEAASTMFVRSAENRRTRNISVNLGICMVIPTYIPGKFNDEKSKEQREHAWKWVHDFAMCTNRQFRAVS